MKQKKWMQVLVCCVLVIAMVLSTACGGTSSNVSDDTKDKVANNDDKSDDGSADEEETVNVEELFANQIVISCLANGPSGSIIDNYADNQFFQRLKEKTGVEIEFTHPIQGSDANEFELMLTGGEYYDIILGINAAGEYVGGDSAAIDDGVYHDLTPYIEKYMPNYYNLLQTNEDVRRAVYTDDGRIACIAGVVYNAQENEIQSQPVYAGITIRKDWLDELGMEVPDTYDELTEVLRKFKEVYGCNQPIIIPGTGYWAQVSAGFGALPSMQMNDDIIEYGPMTDGWKEYLKYIHQWYEEGLISSEFVANNTMGIDEAVLISEDAGAMFMVFSMEDAMETAVGNGADFVALPFPTVNEGEIAQAGSNGSTVTKMAYLTTSLEEEYIPQVLAMFDYLYTDEGIWEAAYGVEGDTYTITEGEVAFTEKIANNSDMDYSTALDTYLCPASLMIIKDWSRDYISTPETQIEMCDVWSNVGNDLAVPVLKLTEEESLNYATVMTDCETYMKEMTIKFILGTLSLEDDWDEYLETLKSFKIEQAVEVYQSAYDRYMGK